MNKKLLKEKNLYEAHKQFMRLCEATYLSDLEEDEESGDEQMSPQDGQDGPQGDMGGDMPPMDDGGMDQGMPPMDDGQGQDMPQDDMGGDMPPMDDGGMGTPMGGDMPPIGDDMGAENDDTVIDVEDITSAQEKMNDKINIVGKDLGKVNDKIESLLSAISSMESMITSQNAEIEAFKNEFEKRNPTQTEKLNLRSLSSSPFNKQPEDYWRKKNMESNYEIYSDNDEPTNSDRELEITNSDVDNFDEREVADSFSIDDDMKQTIEKIFGMS